jgi:hypothetical protein
VGSDSKDEPDGDEIDCLLCSLHRMTISSPSFSPNCPRANPHRSGSPVERSLEEARGASGSGSRSSGLESRLSLVSLKPRPWEGPLPRPRVSPKLLPGDALVKAKVVSSASSTAAVPVARHGAEFRQARSEEGVSLHA